MGLARIFILLLVGGLTACRCGRSDLGGVELGFRVSGDTVEFGRVLEGAQVVRKVTLYSESRTTVTVAASTNGRFSAPPSVDITAGGSAELAVTFTAGDTVATATLTLSANRRSVEVQMRGEGVRPLSCAPSAPCKDARFDLESGACVESESPESSACTPSDVCLNKGLCRSGQCLGTPRGCDDQDKCTNDSCAKSVGCVHTPVMCPAPGQACRIAICDPTSGCGQGPAPDLTLCGTLDCVTMNICQGGNCTSRETPDGTRCSPQTPCQGPGTCQNDVCVRPDAGVMESDYRLTLPFPPVGDIAAEPVLLAHQGHLFFETCGDGGVDAGCYLASFTSTGFQRFFTPHDAGVTARLALVSDGGIALLADDGIRVFTPGTGTPVATYSVDGGTTSVGGVAGLADGTLYASFALAADGGQNVTRFDPDGGVETFEGLGGLAAVQLAGNVQYYRIDGGRSVLQGDGGVLPLAALTDAGESLIAAEDRLVVGGRYLVAPDGGVKDLTPADAGVTDALASYTLMGQGQVVLFDRRCQPEAMSCATSLIGNYARAFAAITGAPLWSGPVDPQPGYSLLDVALAGYGTVLTLTEKADQAWVQLVLGTSRVYSCPLPSGGKIAGATFSRGYLYVIVERSGVWRLEAYDLRETPISTSGWPQRFGVSGQRRAMP
ncbi:MAG: hypothetical protein ACT4TC_24235 [Myxococcaceae bacterium]